MIDPISNKIKCSLIIAMGDIFVIFIWVPVNIQLYISSIPFRNLMDKRLVQVFLGCQDALHSSAARENQSAQIHRSPCPSVHYRQPGCNGLPRSTCPCHLYSNDTMRIDFLMTSAVGFLKLNTDQNCDLTAMLWWPERTPQGYQVLFWAPLQASLQHLKTNDQNEMLANYHW